MSNRANRIFNVDQLSQTDTMNTLYHQSDKTASLSHSIDETKTSKPSRSNPNQPSPSPSKKQSVTTSKRQKNFTSSLSKSPTMSSATPRHLSPDFAEAAKIYDFNEDDQEVDVMQMLSSGVSATAFLTSHPLPAASPGVKGKYVKPKQRWMRQEDMQRYQEARQRNQQKLRELESSGSTAQYVPFPETIVSIPITENPAPEASAEETGASKMETPKKKKNVKKSPPKRKLSKSKEPPAKRLKKEELPATKPKASTSPPSRPEGKKKTPAPPQEDKPAAASPPPIVNRQKPRKSKAPSAPEAAEVKPPVKSSSSSEPSPKVGDICWAKLVGYPHWPCRVEVLAKSETTQQVEATVVWYKWDALKSVLPASRILPFEANFADKFEPKRKGNYRLAVEEAVNICSKGACTASDWINQTPSTKPTSVKKGSKSSATKKSSA